MIPIADYGCSCGGAQEHPRDSSRPTRNCKLSPYPSSSELSVDPRPGPWSSRLRCLHERSGSRGHAAASPCGSIRIPGVTQLKRWPATSYETRSGIRTPKTRTGRHLTQSSAISSRTPNCCSWYAGSRPSASTWNQVTPATPYLPWVNRSYVATHTSPKPAEGKAGDYKAIIPKLHLDGA